MKRNNLLVTIFFFYGVNLIAGQRERKTEFSIVADDSDIDSYNAIYETNESGSPSSLRLGFGSHHSSLHSNLSHAKPSGNSFLYGTSCHAKPLNQGQSFSSLHRPTSSNSPHKIAIKKTPFQIKCSGSYCLARSMKLVNCQTGITIDASDVCLDLNGFTILGGDRGIDILSGSANVQVKNGTVKGCAKDGIRVLKGSRNIDIQNMNIINCNKSEECGGTAGVFFDGVITDVIKNCSLCDVSVTDCHGAGIYLHYSDFCSLTDCFVDMIRSSTLQPSDVYCYIEHMCNASVFERCRASNAFSEFTTTSVAGFYSRLCCDTIFRECQAYNNRILTTFLGGFGFYISRGECISCQDCISDSNGSTGFESSSSMATLMQTCLACKNPIGFVVHADSKSCINQSMAINCTLGPTPFLVYGGFVLTDNSQDCSISSNYAFDNVGPGFNNISSSNSLLFSNVALANNNLTNGNYTDDYVNPPVAVPNVMGSPMTRLSQNLAFIS